jgi:hypothetical protein
VGSVDAIELSPEVVEAAAYFVSENRHAMRDPRLHLYIEDARTFIQRTEKKYDLIISEPSNPWISGVGDLYSVEHFGDCLHALKKGGVMAQWVHTYEMDDDTFKIIVKTFCSVFPDVTLWAMRGPDVLLMGTRNGLKPDFSESERIMGTLPIKTTLARFGLNDVFTLLCLQVGSGKDVRSSVQSETLVNSDYFPLLEYRAPRALYTKSRVGTYLKHLDERKFSLEKYDLLLKPYLQARGVTHDNLRNLYRCVKDEKGGYNSYLALPVLVRLHREDLSDREVLLAYISSDAAPLQENLLELEELIRAGDRSFEFLDLYASLLVKRYFALRSFLTPEIYFETMGKLKLCASMTENRKAKFYYLMGNICLHDRDYARGMSYSRKSKELQKTEGGGADTVPKSMADDQ